MWSLQLVAVGLSLIHATNAIEDLMVMTVDGRGYHTLATCAGGCSGNGECDATTGACECYTEPSRGFWSVASVPPCSECLEGFAGPGCNIECPGGSCNRCHGHGTCHEGRYGNGSCACDFNATVGYWRHPTCENCHPGYYGVECLSKCPGAPTAVCGGPQYGKCSDGMDGNGTCTCTKDPTVGYWGESSGCTDCDEGHYGPRCTLECKGGGERPCSGHGTCRSGKGGDGSCKCDVGWASQDCSLSCPGSNATHVCSGAGTCNDDGTCTCTSANYLAPDCAQCAYGKTGPLCADPCPMNSTGASCSDHGVCKRSGECECFVGYAHSQSPGAPAACQDPCPGIGSPITPCSGNGVCNSATAACSCNRGSATGYWDGVGCETCLKGWSGAPTSSRAGCTLPCPGGTNECNGHGVCLEGMCFCEETYCGTACETKEATPGACRSCPPGTWSHDGTTPECGKRCEGYDGANPATKCSGHGQCKESKAVPATDPNPCTCEPGWGGVDCSKQCPGVDPVSGAPCGGPGRGRCNPDTLQCDCFAGFAGADCGLACPKDPVTGVTCGQRTCFDNIELKRRGGTLPPGASLGDCDCLANCSVPTPGAGGGCSHGLVGTSCNLPCVCTTGLPTGDLLPTGRCLFNGSCECDAGTYSGGYWKGARCDQCADGYYGTYCNMTCGKTLPSGFVTGTTSGTQCRCAEYWAGPGCATPCSGVDTTTGLAAGPICSGHGVCNWGEASTGQCSCEPDYYPLQNCSVQCNTQICRAKGLEYPQCNPDSGACECLDDVTGHWAGAKCNECKLMWWGPTCMVPCDCSMHGGCDADTGECQCFGKWGKGDLYGYWDGRNCERCAEGYVGLQCTGKNVRITRTNTIDTRTSLSKEGQTSLFVDEEEGYIYTGGSPMAIVSLRVPKGTTTSFPKLHTTSRQFLGCKQASEGEAVFVSRHKDTVFFVMQPDATNGCSGFRIVTIPRASGDFSQATTVYTDSTGVPIEATIVDVSMANNSAILAVLLYKEGTNGGYYTRTVDMDTLAPLCSPDTEPLLTDISSIAVSHTGDRIFLTGKRAPPLNTTWGVVEAAVSASGSCATKLHHRETHTVGDPCKDGECWVAQRAVYAEVPGAVYPALVVAIQGQRGSGVAHLDLCPTPPCSALSVQVSEEPLLATAIVIDPFTYVAYATFHKAGNPSTIFKIRFTTTSGNVLPVMYGKLDLTWSITTTGFAPETIGELYPASSWRMLYGLPNKGSTALRLVSFLLYEVHSAAPPIADTKGGTELTVSGSGFTLIDLLGPEAAGLYSPQCRVGKSGEWLPATVVDPSAIKCTTKAVKSSSEQSCEGDPIEVSLYGSTSTFTDNRVGVLRVQSANLAEAIPTEGYWKGTYRNGNPIVVTLKGLGFQQEPLCPECLACRFFSTNKTTTFPSFTASGPAMVTYASPHEIRCKQPGEPEGITGASDDPSWVDVTLDGQVYSGNPLRFTIIGTPSSLWVEPTISVRARREVTLDPIKVHVVDEKGHKMKEHDAHKRPISVQLVEYRNEENVDISDNVTKAVSPNETKLELGATTCEAVDGVCTFPPIKILMPATGSMLLRYSTSMVSTGSRFPTLSLWTTETRILILQGEPVRLIITRQPPQEIAVVIEEESTGKIKRGPFPQEMQPVVHLADEIGNKVEEYPTDVVCTATVRSDPPEYSKGFREFFDEHTTDPLLNGRLAFDDIEINGRFGVTYFLNFTVPNKPEWGWVESTPMKMGKCKGSSTITFYQKLNTSNCEPCPTPGGDCDGSHVIHSLPGWWSLSNSTKFYKCKSTELCLGTRGASRPTGCTEGTEGPLCSVCEAGWGKTPTGSCSKCGSNAMNMGIVISVVVVVILGLVLWIIFTLRKTTDSPLSIISRMLVSHLQVAGKLGEFSVAWAPFLKELFDMQSSGSQVSVGGFAALDCWLRSSGYNFYHIFMGFMFLPVLPFFIGSFVYLYICIRRNLNPSLRDEDGTDPKKVEQLLDDASYEEDEPPPPTNNIYRYAFPQVLLTTYTVCLFVMYPTLTNQAAIMLSCQAYKHQELQQVDTVWRHVEVSTEYYLKADQSISCSTDEYKTYQALATIFLVGYGFGIPLAFVISVYFTMKKRGYEKTYVMFIFLMGGFQQKSWFWQACIMLRKLAIGMISVFVGGAEDADPSNDALQSYFAMWAISLSLIIHLWVSPYTTDGQAPYNKLEAFSLGVIAFTMNMGLLYYWEDIPDAGEKALTATLVLVTLFTLGVFAYFIVARGVYPMFLRACDKDCDGHFSFRDFKILLHLESISEQEIAENKKRVAREKARLRRQKADLARRDRDKELQELDKHSVRESQDSNDRVRAAMDVYDEIEREDDDYELDHSLPCSRASRRYQPPQTIGNQPRDYFPRRQSSYSLMDGSLSMTPSPLGRGSRVGSIRQLPIKPKRKKIRDDEEYEEEMSPIGSGRLSHHSLAELHFDEGSAEPSVPPPPPP
eukprot:Sspe_Gene.59133::Locus_32474_Transcript_1_1_Confidence_1.000_Length_7403::g.59133::m.59133